ncbi:MAG: type II toxin-antitoxin system VapC family toxin [Candidatus Binataceae bacterium]
MPDKVVDASVIAAMAFYEASGDRASESIRGAELFAPDILPYELCSVALKKIKQEPVRAAETVKRLELALSIGVTLVAPDWRRLLTLAAETGLSIYDAAYLQAARRLGCPLVTLDRRLERAFLSIERT